ncbi:hypothetical protein [Muricoccus radiodurans]|uniref:hypothetical protein n=1 Tax=Muricoccus radiodurans TaxID=2231721 RepID=UPI003CEE0C39
MRLDDPALTAAVLDGTTKGLPPGCHVTLPEMGRQGWNVLRGDLPFPVAVIRQSALRDNAAWMRDFTGLNGLDLCPHGKTTMAPQLWAMQLDHGAWGITVATIQQLQVALHFGVPRVILANQPIGRLAVDACFAALASTDLHVLADSLSVVEGLAVGAARAGAARPLKVLLELGVPGGRTGARDPASALAVARAVAAAPGLALAGVEAFEGILPDTAAVDAFLDALVETGRACGAEDLFGTEDALLTAGGTAFFDRIGLRFAGVDFGRPTRKVLRSGCYLTHDSLGYEAAYRRMRDEAALRFPNGDLTAAMEVWTAVQSVPEPGRAILTAGKRDISADIGNPVPLWMLRAGRDAAPVRVSPFHKISALNDQHAYLTGPDDLGLAVGDLVALGLGHPCTTFDKWTVIPLVDDDLTVTGAVRTFF